MTKLLLFVAAVAALGWMAWNNHNERKQMRQQIELLNQQVSMQRQQTRQNAEAPRWFQQRLDKRHNALSREAYQNSKDGYPPPVPTP